jgi:hypothetical protein
VSRRSPLAEMVSEQAHRAAERTREGRPREGKARPSFCRVLPQHRDLFRTDGAAENAAGRSPRRGRLPVRVVQFIHKIGIASRAIASGESTEKASLPGGGSARKFSIYGDTRIDDRKFGVRRREQSRRAADRRGNAARRKQAYSVSVCFNEAANRRLGDLEWLGGHKSLWETSLYPALQRPVCVAEAE